MNVRHIVTILTGVKTDFVRSTMHHSALQSSAGHPNAETEDMVIATIGALRSRRSAEFGGKHDNRFIQQTSALQVDQQTANRLIDGLSQTRVIAFQSAKRIPSASAPPPCWICTKRTPCSTQRRAASS